MSYNNFRLNLVAKNNLSEFQKYRTYYSSMGDKEKLYSNLQSAEGLVKSLVEDRDIVEDDINHKIISQSISNMTNIFVKNNVSLEDIEEFYSSYENVENIHNKFRGDKND